jgi:hypothetical protein
MRKKPVSTKSVVCAESWKRQLNLVALALVLGC